MAAENMVVRAPSAATIVSATLVTLTGGAVLATPHVLAEEERLLWQPTRLCSCHL